MGRIVEGFTQTAAADVAQRLVDDPTPATWVVVQDLNVSASGGVVVGGPTVIAALPGRRGVLLNNLASQEVMGVRIPGPLDLKDLWFASVTNTIGVGISYIYEEP